MVKKFLRLRSTRQLCPSTKQKEVLCLNNLNTIALSIFSGVIGIAITIVKIDKEENNGTAKKK